MWDILEHRRVVRHLSRTPIEVLKRYEKWKDIVHISGPSGLWQIKGFDDESLRGDWRGHRSSRLGDQYRIIYKVEREQARVFVIEIMAHDHRRRWNMSPSSFRRARKSVDVSVGESVRIIRELQELTQSDLAAMTGIPQSTISAIENNRVNLGVERAKTIARALKCHPAILVFPGWDVKTESAA